MTLLSADVLKMAFYMAQLISKHYGTAHYTGETLVYVTLLSADVLKTAFYMAQLIILGKH